MHIHIRNTYYSNVLQVMFTAGNKTFQICRSIPTGQLHIRNNTLQQDRCTYTTNTHHNIVLQVMFTSRNKMLQISWSIPTGQLHIRHNTLQQERCTYTTETLIGWNTYPHRSTGSPENLHVPLKQTSHEEVNEMSTGTHLTSGTPHRATGSPENIHIPLKQTS